MKTGRGIFPLLDNQEAFSPYRRAWKKDSPITAAQRAAGLSKIEEKIKELKRDPADYTPHKIVGRGNKNGIAPNDRASDVTIGRYKCVWDSLLDFVILMEDWKSGMILHPEKCPPNPLPLNVDIAILYLYYHTLPKGVKVPDIRLAADKDGNQPPLTIPGSNGSPLLAVGDWQGSSTLGIFRSALSKLHEHFDLCRDSYIHDCPSCRNPKEGCNLHTVSRFWRKGNVIRSPKFKTHLSLQEHYVEEKYESKSTMAFQPFELRLIRDHLVTSCEPEKLMLWTLMMTGIRLFL